MKQSSTIVLVKTLRFFAHESGLDADGEIDFEDVYSFLYSQLASSTNRSAILTLCLAYDLLKSDQKQLSNGEE